MGNLWQSTSGLNLTFSVYKRIENELVEEPFGLIQRVSLALINCLEKFSIPDLSIKLPTIFCW